MTALQEWKTHLAACRRERKVRDDVAWQQLASWYDDWVRSNDYVDIVLARLLRHVGATARVLEVGPGTGGFTLPLARAAREVVAVEPSSAMREKLIHNLAQAGISNVHIIPQRIEETLAKIEGPFDLALASHSLYNVEPIDEVVWGLVRLARHVAILMGSGDRLAWCDSLRQRFNGKECMQPPLFRQFYAVLLEMSIHADVDVLWTSSNYVFDSEDALVERWTRDFGLDGTDCDALLEALLEKAERQGDHIGIYARRRSALVWIERERSVLKGEG